MRSLFLLLLALVSTASIPAQDPDAATDAELIRMERLKWDPASYLHPFRMMGMFSSEMLSVDYGSDLQGDAERRTWKEVLGYGQLPDWKMQLDGWQVVRPSPEVVILSYRVTGISVGWKAYATSVWAKRDGKWKTVFYQASRAK